MLHALFLGGLIVLGANDPFETLKVKALEVESPQKLLEAYAGRCKATDPVEAQECAQRARSAQVPFKGKALYINLGGGFENLMQSIDADAGRAAVLLTPVIDVGNGLALTFAKPQKIDKDGTIIVPRYPVEGPLLDDNVMASDLKRLLRTGQVSLEVIGTVKGMWEMKKKDGDTVRGVQINVRAVRLSNRRTGKALVSQVKGG